MPGIAGIISKKNDKHVFDKMFTFLNHENYKIEKYINNGIHLGRIHLNYINKEKQPLLSGDSRHALIFFGEIYSYKTIKKVESSSKLFLQIFTEKGTDCLSDINGQYTACVYDFFEKKLFLISDRFSTRPVYYTFIHNNFLFAPEVKALFAEPGVKKNINYDSVSELFNFGHLFENKTMFKDIHRLPEASYLEFKDGKISIHKYWDSPYIEENYLRTDYSRKEIDNYIDEMQQIILTATKKQLVNNTDSIVLSLSGGLDSRFVAALIDKVGIKNTISFTMGEFNSEDAVYAKLVAEALGINHKIFNVKPENIWKDAEYFSYVSDGMSMISGPIQAFESLRNYYNKRQITFSSQMCDAMFGSTLCRTKLQTVAKKRKLDDESSKIVKEIFNIFPKLKIKQIFNSDFYTKIESGYSVTPAKYVNNDFHPLHSYFNLLINEHGRRGTLGGNLVYNLFFETRMPSYDNDLVEFSYKVPIALKQNQYLYRESFIRMFPELAGIKREGTNLPINVSESRLKIKILERKIIGRLKFTSLNKIIKNISRWNKPSYVSYDKWFRHELKQKMEDFIFDPKTLSRGIYSLEGIKKLLDEHYHTEKDNSGLIWQIINLEYFFRNFID